MAGALRFNAIDWDTGNLTKCLKHGLTVDEIEYVLWRTDDVWDDPWNSADERRFRVIGQNEDGRYVFIVVTLRDYGTKTFVRPISARYMHLKEIERYERD